MWPFKKLPPSNQNIEYFASARIKILDALTYCNKRRKEQGGTYFAYSLIDDPSKERFVINYTYQDLWEIYYFHEGRRRGYQYFREVDALISYMGDFLNKPPNQMHRIKVMFSVAKKPNNRNAEYFDSARIKILDTLNYHNKLRKEKTGTYFNFSISDPYSYKQLVIIYKNEGWEIYTMVRKYKVNYRHFEDVNELIVHLFEHWGGGKVPDSF